MRQVAAIAHPQDGPMASSAPRWLQPKSTRQSRPDTSACQGRQRPGDVGAVEAVVRNGVVSPPPTRNGFASAMSHVAVGCYLLDLPTAHQPHAALVGGEGQAPMGQHLTELG